MAGIREGGAHGMAQAEAEYKDFILFYPAMEEAAEAQEKICKMQYKQMEKADRDPTHALRAEDECRQLLMQFPNSKFAPEAQQMLRNIQEVLARQGIQGRLVLSQQGQHAGGGEPAAGRGRPVPALQQGRRGAVAAGRFLPAAWATVSRTSRPTPTRESSRTIR